jgi:hypothetical protein
MTYNNEKKNIEKQGYISSTKAIDMLCLVARELDMSHSLIRTVIDELPENVPFIKIGQGRGAKRYYHKKYLEEYLAYLSEVE